MYSKVSDAHLMSHSGHSTRSPDRVRSPGIVSAALLIPAVASLARSSEVRGSEHARINRALRSRKLCRTFITAVNADDPA